MSKKEVEASTQRDYHEGAAPQVLPPLLVPIGPQRTEEMARRAAATMERNRRAARGSGAAPDGSTGGSL